MPLFQNTVVAKYLRSQNSSELQEKWELYKLHFFNPIIQENIRNSKEEQYQEGFLRDLFVKILGYTLNPEHNFNLTTELKNVKDSKKADGGIIINEKVVGVVELKGTNTTDLGKVEEQAFGYKNNQRNCVYVITSNFEKLRFYIDNAIEHIEFNLFTLTEKDFELLYLCLGFENIKNNIPKKLKEESLSQEESITKKLYKDYSLFKRELFQNLCELNPQFEPLELFKKSQKLLDRCLFLFFAEDRNLLPPNSVRLILKQWKQLHELDAYTPLYGRFKKYFGYLNTGFKGKQYDVFAYNGGLFKPDPVLDTITIDDDLLYRHSYKLSEYNFQSEVDVNILGHIFENSLNELDEITAQLEGQVIDKSSTKRKKDGVFYTPKYITKYIVENTIGKLCEEKKSELDITDEAYQPTKQRSRKRLENLNSYRNWLLELTICDPACGSGAFLNQALDFLIQEHRYIDELSAKYNKDAFVLSDVEKGILENNLFGVDINEESVQIAKLSLWLRTAQPNRKLNDLSDNIKCGNSLIDDVSVAGDKAFNWEKEFPQIFEKGGFDVVIGNPPYVQSHSLDETTKQYIYKNFLTAEYQINTYAIFMEKMLSLLKSNGKYSAIIPNYWISTKYDSKLRALLFLNNRCTEILNVFRVFEDATVDTVIVSGIKESKPLFPKSTFVRAIDSNYSNIDQRLTSISEKKWAYQKEIEFKDLEADTLISFSLKIKITNCTKLSEFVEGFQGMKPYEKGKGTPIQTREMMTNKIYHSIDKIDSDYLPLIGSANVQRYHLKEAQEYIKYGNNLAAPRKFKIFSQPRILVNRIFSKEKIDVTYFEDIVINNTDVFNFIPREGKTHSLKSLLAILASKFAAFHLKSSNVNLNRQAFPKLNVTNLLNFPIPNITNTDINSFDANTEILLSLNRGFQEMSIKFQRSIQRNFEVEKLPKKLENWHALTFGEFVKELKKKKVVLSLTQQAEWEDYFLEEQQKALEIQNQITITDKEIDAMVYELYGLTEEEIAIVEGS